MLNLDTHILVALLAGTLSAQEGALVADESLAVSDIVLWEIAKLVQLGRLEMDLEDATYLRCLERIRVIPISPEIARFSTKMDFTSDPADEIIAATSLAEGIPLLTRDRRIRRSKIVPLARTRVPTSADLPT
jgi:PIN domain nuclease of toxin-antitoxin system